MNMGNVHRMFITYIHRTQESRNTKNTYDFLVQVRNFLLPLSLKVLRHKERDTHSFYSDFSIWPPPPQHVCTRRKASASKRKSTIFSRGRTQLNWLFQNPPNPPRASGAWRHPHSLARFAIWAIVTSLSDTPFRPRAWTPALMLHLSNPCTEPKGSQTN